MQHVAFLPLYLWDGFLGVRVHLGRRTSAYVILLATTAFPTVGFSTTLHSHQQLMRDAASFPMVEQYNNGLRKVKWTWI